MQWIFDRLNEQSTWKGIFGILTAAGIVIKPELAAAIMAAGMAAIGLLNVIRNEAPKP